MYRREQFEQLQWSADGLREADLFVIELEPLSAAGVAVGVVVASMDASTVNQDTVQSVLVAYAAVGVL